MLILWVGNCPDSAFYSCNNLIGIAEYTLEIFFFGGFLLRSGVVDEDAGTD